MSEARGGGRRDKQVSMSSRACWTVFLAFFALGVVSSVSLNKAAPVLTVIGADFGMDLGALGWINSCFSVMGMAVAFPAALLIRKLGFKGCVAVSGAAIVVGGLLGLFAATTPVFLASRVIEGLALLRMSRGVSTRRIRMVKTTMAQPQFPTQLLIQLRKLNTASFMLGYSLLMIVYRSSGTGSYPPLLKGLHRSSRHRAIHPPFQAPYR